MVPLALADEVEISHAQGHGISLTCNDPDLPTGPDNLCVRAAEAFREETGIAHGIAISLMKKIPHGAGLGGGSSDAAAVLKGMNELFDRPLVPGELHQLAASIGSDVAFFLNEGPAWCRGRGEILEPLGEVSLLPRRTLLLIKPPFPVPTAWAYQKYAEMKSKGSLPTSQEVQHLGGLEIVNDLEAPVFDKYLLLPVMKKWLLQCEQVEAAFMTGSGSTMVAVLKPDLSPEKLSALKQSLGSEFGETMWLCQTGF